ncbi:MAG: cyclic pyranopterin phosphate synthase MoaA [Deltaproteobacteria bacterium GWA2_45_12]|nr:MAG: cyclic pyranopterin phosphate synthase MoaA [Deltaproteobacteria bacterium GWA2_45_12]
MIKPLTDSHGRAITYLRLSVTDRCPFRCVYCLPAEGIKLLPKEDYLEPAKMEQFVRAVSEMGVWRLRLTGGEPLIRKDILSLVARFSSIPGIRDLALTTNGAKLSEIAWELKEAGLQRINISLDSLDPARFQELTGSNSFHQVWSGILRSLEAGLKVKINVVALKGISDEEIDGFSALAFRFPLEVRFIEFMPLCGTAWKPEMVVPIETIRGRIAGKYKIEPLLRGTEVAESHELVGGKGRVGFIASMTEPFCSKCSRIRMSATGKIQLCLFSNLQHDFHPSLRNGHSIIQIQEEMHQVILGKPASHPWVNKKTDRRPEENASIRSIGG